MAPHSPDSDMNVREGGRYLHLTPGHDLTTVTEARRDWLDGSFVMVPDKQGETLRF